MSKHYAILDDRPERINRLRFLLHLRGIQALLALDAAEVLNWRSACRQTQAELCGVMLYAEPENMAHLGQLAETGFDLPVYAIKSTPQSTLGGEDFTPLQLFVGSVEEILQVIPAQNRPAQSSFPERLAGASL